MLKLSGITKSYDGLPVLSDLSLTLSPGEIVALIGPSGCGKTTLLNLISGLATPDTGIQLCGIMRDKQHGFFHAQALGI